MNNKHVDRNSGPFTDIIINVEIFQNTSNSFSYVPFRNCVTDRTSVRIPFYFRTHWKVEGKEESPKKNHQVGERRRVSVKGTSRCERHRHLDK